MTETQWTSGADPGLMLEFLKNQASDRKLRLFAAACCRCSTKHMMDESNRRVVDIAERYAEGSLTLDDLAAAQSTTGCWFSYVAAPHGYQAASRVVSCLSEDEGIAAAQAEGLSQFGSRNFLAIHKALADLLRECFGNPYRSLYLDSSWLTPNVLRLAQAIYDERTFERMPALADALEEAGCFDSDKLSHCRGPGPHVRGCWLLDIILGKN
jgi:hypothetical protein